MIYKSYQVELDTKIVKQNLVLFYGENLGLQDDIRRKIKLNYPGSEILYFDQDDLLKNKKLIFNEMNNDSLFNKQKIFLIGQVNEKIFDLIKEIDDKNDKKIFLFGGLLEKKSKLRNFFEKENNCAVVPCYEDNEINIKRIILYHLKNYQGLTNNIISLIIEKTGLNRVKLNNELQKITSLFHNRTIDLKKLEQLLNLKENDDFNKLKDMAFNGNKEKTNNLLSETNLEYEKNIYYLNMINNRLQKLLELKKNKKNQNISDDIDNLKPPIFWKEKPNFSIQAKKWCEKKILTIMRKTYKLEIELKSNPKIDKNILLKKLMVDICETANS
tara:strand:- start:55 stop:1041 length:987 start_codon:yes stop_codon:yes gene_type:complete